MASPGGSGRYRLAVIGNPRRPATTRFSMRKPSPWIVRVGTISIAVVGADPSDARRASNRSSRNCSQPSFEPTLAQARFSRLLAASTRTHASCCNMPDAAVNSSGVRTRPSSATNIEASRSSAMLIPKAGAEIPKRIAGTRNNLFITCPSAVYVFAKYRSANDMALAGPRAYTGSRAVVQSAMLAQQGSGRQDTLVFPRSSGKKLRGMLTAPKKTSHAGPLLLRKVDRPLGLIAHQSSKTIHASLMVTCLIVSRLCE